MPATLCSVQWDRVLHHAEEGDVEQTLIEIAKWFQIDKLSCEDEGVKACLDSASEHCYEASFLFYASTK